MKYTEQMDFNWFLLSPTQPLLADVVNFYDPFRVCMFGVKQLMFILY